MILIEKSLVMKKSPTAICHASTVLKLPSGEFLCAWFGGSEEGASDVGIYLSRRKEGGDFLPPVCMAESSEAHWNPVLFSSGGGKVILYYKTGQKISDWRTYIRISEDGGNTFGPEKELVKGDSGGRGPVKNKPIRLTSGRVLAPGSLEKNTWKAFADWSEDGGETFTQSNLIGIPGIEKKKCQNEGDIPVSSQSFHHRGVIQPTLWEDTEGVVHMLLRSSEGRVYRSDSHDGGSNWSEAYMTNVLNNNSGLDLTRLSDGRIVLVHNPVGKSWGARTPLSVSVSEDNGRSFNKVFDLEKEEGEYSYPAIISEGNDCYITYTLRRENIAFCHLKAENLKI
ncbi:MAG: sialidase family protein [Eubacteriales bacterium]|nr:sialidase family protein [Eubacteriales bacterium]